MWPMGRLEQVEQTDELFDKIQWQQDSQLPHARLCERICKYQVHRGRHFHLEQPAGSSLLHLKIFEVLRQKTAIAKFDMCQFGLRIPKTNRFLRKSSQLMTSSREVFPALHGQKCTDSHDHQRLEGSMVINGQTQRLTSFSATYCLGFAKVMAKKLCSLAHSYVGFEEHVLTGDGDAALERPNKRFKSEGINVRKRKEPSEPGDMPKDFKDVDLEETEHQLPDSNLENAKPGPIAPDMSREIEPWQAVMREAALDAPRVGNARCSMDSQAWHLAQQILKATMTLTDMFVCRGTERFQVPLHAPSSHHAPLRYTVSIHRTTSQVHDLGVEDWHKSTRAQRIRKSIPSKLTVTMFGHLPNLEQADVPARESIPADVPVPLSNVPPESVEPPSAVRATGNQNLPIAVQDRTSNVACEGWAPPPVPLHGPKFRLLNDQEKQDLIKIHKNLGHPDPTVLAQHLKLTGASENIVEAAKEYICDACVESSKFRHQRPAKLHDPREFNDMVGIDGFFWTGRGGFQVFIFHCIDEASLFHLGRRLDNRHLEHAIPAFSDMWFAWAGHPSGVYSDPAGEFRSSQWLDFLQSHNVEPRFSTEAWQKGRIDCHGQIIKNMLSRYDQEKVIENIQEFDSVLLSCFQAKNALTRSQGFSPEQIVLGKSTRLPASLTSDESAAAHSLADGSDLASERFRRSLEVRSRARKVFLLADNDSAIRRALLRKSQPHPGSYAIGQSVMYWRKRNTTGRRDVGRWHGPARVVCTEGTSTIWVAHGDRLLRCAPESVRSASLREWQNSSGTLDQQVQDLQTKMSDHLGQPAMVDAQPFQHPDEENEYSPGSLVGSPNGPMSHQTSMQPESEDFPEPMDSTTNTPLHNHPNNQDNSSNPNNPTNFNTENAIDLDATEPVVHDLDAEDAQVLSCHEIDSLNTDHALHEWTVFQRGTESGEICLAEDGMPFIQEQLEPHMNQCFFLEVPLSRQDLLQWSQSSHPEELAQVASASKRARAEVQLKDLNADERKLFSAAKDAEISCWLQTSALKPVLRKHLNPEQILKSRWVLTWKNVSDDDNVSGGRKAKARLVVLGFQDPRITEVNRDAPTLTKEGRHTVLQLIASQHWTLTSFDIKTAFLRGKADSDNPLAMEPPREVRERMQLSEDQVCALIGNAYGRVDAPLLFYKELAKQLENLGFKMHPLEPCVYYLETWKNGLRTLHGVLGTHVDDGICGGDSWFHSRLDLLRQQLPFGSFEQRKFTFTGIQLEQLPDHSIRACQQDYVQAIPYIEVGKHRRNNLQEPITEKELSNLRGLIGSLQYATSNTRPDISAKLGEIQVQISKPTVSTLLEANKVLREAQSTSDVSLCFRAIDPQELTHVVFGDASFASPKQLASFQGTMVFATTPNLQNNKVAPISPLTWSSKKIPRVVRSTLSAEAFSMSRSIDKMGWCRLLWGTLFVPEFNWRCPQDAFRQLPAATVVTDCKSLFDFVSRRAMPTCEEYRTTLEVLLNKERCLEHCLFRWIPTALQLADPLTKNMDSSLLRAALEQGSFQLFDEAASLQANAHRKQALQWFRESHQHRI